MLVTHYAGTKMVKVYNAGTEEERGTKAGYINIEDDSTVETGDENNVALKSEGSYYPVGTAGGNEGDLGSDDDVAANSKPVEVFSYVDLANDDTKKYVVLTTESKTAGTTTYIYTNVDVTAAAAPDGDDDDTAADLVQVRAVLPEASEYKHIHFGVWAALGAAEKSGLQELSDLGVGFVQSIGDGLSGAECEQRWWHVQWQLGRCCAG